MQFMMRVKLLHVSAPQRPPQAVYWNKGSSILILLASCQENLYDIYHRCVYSKELLMMDRKTVRNM